MSYERYLARNIFARQTCPTDGDACPPLQPCGECPTDHICQQTLQTCDVCPENLCVPNPDMRKPSGGGGPNIGAIVGGVLGGSIAVAIAVYLIWRFCVKNRRSNYEMEYTDQYSDEATEAEKDFASRRDARASTFTVGSIASSVMTRASNIIQIAYIPGVTNRSAPSTPGLLVPPVPPIPIALSHTSTPSYDDQHFFMPGDLRDSTYSGISYAPRSSVASTVYGKNAVISQIPAQTAMRGKAAVVSVKSSANSTAGDMTPPMPTLDRKFLGADPNNNRPTSAFSIGSIHLDSSTTATATQMRPKMVKVVSSTKVDKSKSNLNTTIDEGVEPEEAKSPAITVIDDTPAVEQGPFGDPAPSPKAAGHSKKVSLSESIKMGIQRASVDVQAGLGADKEKKKKDGGPFGDENATS